MCAKKLPFSNQEITRIAEQYGTPFHIYDEKGIRENARYLKDAFSWNQGFKEYFAVKAAPNPFLMTILKEEGFGADCSSLPEMILAQKCGITGENIVFTSNDTPISEYKKAHELGAVINLDDISHINYLETHSVLPELISIRYNPGAMREGNAIIGKPEEAKYGFTRKQVFDGYRLLKSKGVKRFGLHTMIASNELDPVYFIETAQMLFTLAAEIAIEVGIKFELINLGGGIGIPYRPGDSKVDLTIVSRGVKNAYDSIIKPAGLDPVRLCLESGRMITGPYGYLVSKVLHLKDTYKKYVGLDSCMADLMRPALYGAYHHITVIGKDELPHDTVYDVTGSLCENNDKFAINRPLPRVDPGDLVVIHDTGAHGHAMGFNYNGKLRSAELLYRIDGSIELIRRAETVDDYFATLDFEKLASFR